MKILVEGRKGVKKVRRFECGTCGCVFLAERHEYVDQNTCRLTEYGIRHAFECDCPNCSDVVVSTYDEEIVEERDY